MTRTPTVVLTVEVPKEWRESSVAMEDGYMLQALGLDEKVRCLWVTDKNCPERSFSYVMRLFKAVEEVIIYDTVWTCSSFIRTMQRTEQEGIKRLRFLTEETFTRSGFHDLVRLAQNCMPRSPLQEVSVGTEYLWKPYIPRPLTREELREKRWKKFREEMARDSEEKHIDRMKRWATKKKGGDASSVTGADDQGDDREVQDDASVDSALRSGARFRTRGRVGSWIPEYINRPSASRNLEDY